MTWFYRMRLGQINSLLFVAFMLSFLFISAFFARVWLDFDIKKTGVFAICIGVIIGFALLNTCSYNNPVDGKHSIRMKMFLDANGMNCKDKELLIWSCSWNSVHHLEVRCNIHRCRSVYVYLSENEEKPFFFEYSRSAKKALFKICPREDLLNQI